MEIFKRLSRQVLIDLQNMEGDYRAASLAVDKAQTILAMSIAALSIISMLTVDILFFQDSPEFFWYMMLYRGGFVLFTVLVITFIAKTELVRIFDRIFFWWLVAIIIFLLLFNFTRPAGYLTTVFDIITIFSIYVLSPLRFKQNLVLAVCFSIGTL